MSETVLMRLYSGEDVLTTIAEETDDAYQCENIVVAVPAERGHIGFAPWAPIAKEGVSIRIAKDYIVYVTEPNPDLAEQYEGLFSTVITPKKKLIV